MSPFYQQDRVEAHLSHAGEQVLRNHRVRTQAADVNLIGFQQLIDPFFKAIAEAVEETITNALVSAEDMYGRNRNFVPALPLDQVKQILKKYRGYLDMAYPQTT